MRGRPKRDPAILRTLVALEFQWQIAFSGMREGLPNADTNLQITYMVIRDGLAVWYHCLKPIVSFFPRKQHTCGTPISNNSFSNTSNIPITDP